MPPKLTRRDEVRLHNAQAAVERADEYVDYLERCRDVAQGDLEARQRELKGIEAMVANANND